MEGGLLNLGAGGNALLLPRGWSQPSPAGVEQLWGALGSRREP